MIEPFNYIPFSTVCYLFCWSDLCYFEYSILLACIVRKNIKLYPLVYTFCVINLAFLERVPAINDVSCQLHISFLLVDVSQFGL